MEVISLKRGLTAHGHAAGLVVVGYILYAVGLRLGDGVRGGGIHVVSYVHPRRLM